MAEKDWPQRCDAARIIFLPGLRTSGFILAEPNKNKQFPMINFGLYGDDGHGCHKRIPGPTLEKPEKDIIKLFQDNGLQIKIEMGLKLVDYLDVNYKL